jgi:hypothetical protein
MIKCNYVSYLNSKFKPFFGTLITTKHMLNLMHKKIFLNDQHILSSNLI